MALQYSFTPSKACIFWAPDQSERFVNSLFPNQKVADNSRARPEMSRKAQRRIRQVINWMCYLSRHRNVRTPEGKIIKGFQIAFVTLTLPTKQMHPHKEIVSKCLNRFLTEARRKWGVENYVWKLELQKNGNIHFHITWDKFVRWQDIRTQWNNAISKLGYTAAYQNQMQQLSFQEYCYWRRQNGSVSKKRLQEAYDYGQRTQWQNPNSTDVRNVKDIKNLASYLSKYLSKPAADSETTGLIADSLEELTGRLWYCSQSLSRLKTAVEPFEAQISRFFRHLVKKCSFFISPNDFVEVAYFRLNKLGANAKDFLREILVSHAINQYYPFPAGLP